MKEKWFLFSAYGVVVDAKPDRRMPQIERGTHARTDGHSTNIAPPRPHAGRVT